MVQVFATRAWGADFESWPVMTFGEEGYRARFIESRAQPGDLICVATTQNENVAEKDRGRLIAIAECALIPLDSEAVIGALGGLKPQHYNKKGKFKWRFAVPYLRAWKFDDPPLIKDLLGRQLKMETLLSVELLSPHEARAVLDLPRTEVVLPQFMPGVPPARPDPPEPAAALEPTKGPPPMVGGYFITQEHKPASVYVLRFGDTDVFKIGWAFDVTARLSDINKHVPHELLKQHWRLFGTASYKDQFAAYAAEQTLFKTSLKAYRTAGERVRLPVEQMREIWKSAHAG